MTLIFKFTLCNSFAILLLINSINITKCQEGDFPAVPAQYKPYQLTGNLIEEGQFQYIVSLQNESFHFCAGSIITPIKVFTSCSCVSFWDDKIRIAIPKNTSSLNILAGSKYLYPLGNGYQKRGTKKIYLHPQCSRISDSGWTSNVAFIQPSESFIFDQYVSMAPIFSYEGQIILTALTELLKAQGCITVGWGSSIRKNERAELKIIPVQIMKYQDCKNITCDKDPNLCMPNNIEYICAQTKSLIKNDTCIGDVGSPLVCYGYVWGVAGYQPPCTTDQPNLYSVLLASMGFIKKLVNQANKSSTSASVVVYASMFIFYVSSFVIDRE